MVPREDLILAASETLNRRIEQERVRPENCEMGIADPA